MQAKIDIQKLQVLNDRINQTLEALNELQQSVHGLSAANPSQQGIPAGYAPYPYVQPFHPVQPTMNPAYPGGQFTTQPPATPAHSTTTRGQVWPGAPSIPGPTMSFAQPSNSAPSKLWIGPGIGWASAANGIDLKQVARTFPNIFSNVRPGAANGAG